MTILVTGGAGYIGSHAVRALTERGFAVVVLDNLVHGHRDVVEGVLGVPLVVGQVGERALLEALLAGEHPATAGAPVQAVLHFAAYAYVGESVADPARYYRNNTGDALVLLEALVAAGRRRGGSGTPIPIVFSSTCATYGIPDGDRIPIRESTPQQPINPYGRSKAMVEQMLADFGAAYGLASVIFRYFNAAGAHPHGDLGEDHRPETHLIPLTLEAMAGRRPLLRIYGDDYPTADGTCLRDYIHVCDLAEAHVLGLGRLLEQGGRHVYNLGTGRGWSVREVIAAAEGVTGFTAPIAVAPRRPGDPPVLVAAAEKAGTELGWRPRHPELGSMIEHAWAWHRRRWT